MRDYAELISDLRRHHCDAKEDDTQEVCEECAYDVIVSDKSKFSGITDVCTCGLMHRDADAIEELLDELTTIRKQFPRWISVDERLPEFHTNDSGCVCTRNIVFRTEYKTVHLGYVIRTAHNIETVDGFEQIVVDRWYDQSGDMIEDVTHWMPLPEPPKGVE